LHRRTALTLLEMMVAVTLLAVIMVGLLAMFQYTQRALHVAHMQTDVFENARGAIQLVTRDLAEMSAYNDTNVANAYGVSNTSPVGSLLLVGPPSTNLPVYFEEAFWLTHVNDDWQGIGYYVDGASYGVGTLYRFSETTNYWAAPSLRNRFLGLGPAHRVSDGIVHFSMEAVYVDRAPTSASGKEQYIRVNNFTFPLNDSNALPVFVDLEIGVLEPATLKQFNSLTSNVSVAQNFLRDHVGRIHFFRERVPIHNFINPYRVNDLQ
jgi:type II secretory pathway pseudopilin PulG